MAKACEDGVAAAGCEYYGDGCDWKCNLEAGFTCPAVGACTEICGQGTYDSYNYECDDGNNIDLDGCDSNCEIETGYLCYGGDPITHDACWEICGDGIRFSIDIIWCDDANHESGDGCSSICHVERGYSCIGGTTTTPDVCTEICGDGIDHGFYECDDGNLEDGDGCSSTCTVENGYTCFGGNFDQPDECDETCGDSIRVVTDAGRCDDGNIYDDDGCNDGCYVE